jgi:hypothetical protein
MNNNRKPRSNLIRAVAEWSEDDWRTLYEALEAAKRVQVILGES